jgi:hypothetical protein
VLEDPFVGDNDGANRTRDKIPSIIGDQNIIFFFHGTASGRSARAAWTDVGTRERDDDEVANMVSLSVGSWKPHFTRVVIG